MHDASNDPSRAMDQALSEERINAVRMEGGVFVDAVRVTRVPMLVTDPALPGNPVVFANPAFLAMAGYAMEEVIGREPHFMDGSQTDPASVARFDAAIQGGRDEVLDLLQCRRHGSTLTASVFVSPLRDESSHAFRAEAAAGGTPQPAAADEGVIPSSLLHVADIGLRRRLAEGLG